MNDNMRVLLDEFNPVNVGDTLYAYNGQKVPRVTKILSKCIHNDSLMYWANSLGFKHMSYKKTLNAAADIGTACHAMIDNYIISYNQDGELMIVEPAGPEANYAYRSFVEWFNRLTQNNDVEVTLHEKTLICKYFGGTLDGLYKINGIYYIVDYKTSNHITYNYCLQVAAYRYMVREILGIEVGGVIILQLSKGGISFKEYVLDFRNQNHLEFINNCERTFMSLVYSYYNIMSIEQQFNNISWERVVDGA